MLHMEHELGGDNQLPAVPIAGRGRTRHGQEVESFFRLMTPPCHRHHVCVFRAQRLRRELEGWMDGWSFSFFRRRRRRECFNSCAALGSSILSDSL